ncbi:MAG: SpoIIE family protein phosphatase [Leptospira sp.]|nr:SpoIIE family protein phosphatase [Leptospira sp.]
MIRKESQFTILVVDDAQENVSILERLLRSENYNVLKAFSADEARGILVSQNVDLLLLDVNMPVQDGYSFCKELREIERFELLPIIFITAVDRESGFQEAINNGGDDFISKPFNKKELVAKIKAFKRIKNLQDELLKEKLRYEKEMKAARKVQEQLIPLKSIEWNGIKASTYFHPLFQIGGDFVDIWIEGDKLHAVIADCSGHGPSAALVGVIFKMQLMHTGYGDSLVDKITTLRKNLKGVLPEDYFITFVYVTIDSQGFMEYIKCGHPEPILYSNGEVITLPGLSPMIVDVDLKLSDSICNKQLERGSTLLLYTDGLEEATNQDLEMVGTDGLSRIFQASLEEEHSDLFKNIIGGVLEFCGDMPPEDDMAMICIKF